MRNTKAIPKDYDQVKLADILVDDEHHCREGLKDHIVARYESVYRTEMHNEIKISRMPPLEVALINDVLVLFDGYHRFRAMKNCGVEEAHIIIHHDREYKELPYLAAQVNLNHGVYMSNKDVREIANDFNLAYTHNTFRNWMKADFPSVFRAMADDDDGEIEFEAIDPDVGHIKAAVEDLDRVSNRFKSIKCDEARVELWNIFVEFYSQAYTMLPSDCEEYESFREVTHILDKEDDGCDDEEF